jgi:molybdopterin-guanine dinucleotide biosynthesis protein A
MPDLRPGLGPLAGIETALVSGRGDFNLILACDLPLIESEWLKVLLEIAQARNARCLVASETGGRVHPLCGVYRSDCLAAIRCALDRGHLRVMEMLDQLGAEHFEVTARMWNVNTPEEWRLCQDVANGR